MMRAPTLSEPKSTTFPTYQVPQESAMRGSAPPVQVARAVWGGRADLPTGPTDVRCSSGVTSSVINGSSCRPTPGVNSNVKMQSVTDNCLLNSVTVPKIQRKDHHMVAHNNINNNSDKLDNSKFGALPLGRDIPNQKSEDLEVLDDLNALKIRNITADICDNNDNDERNIDVDYHNDTKTVCHPKRLTLRTINDKNDDYIRLGYDVPPLRLKGGGESSLSTGTSGWGTPPSQQASNNNGNKANTNGQQPPPTSQSGTGWAQPGPKPPGANNGPAATSAPPPNNAQTINGQNNTTKQQLEHLKDMREAIFSQDGWGGQHVNQDTNWDIPASPEPPLKVDGSGPPPWKPPVNNGTELWEANLRNGGQPPPQPQQKTPWGHTPTSNIGGTWGEDDDPGDSSNVWTGVPANQPPWAGGNNNSNNSMWGGPKKENDWSAGAGNTGWVDPRSADPRATGMDMRPEMRDLRTAAANLDPRLDPREQMRQMTGGDMRGDPRGITGRLNGAGAEAFWGQSGPHAGPTGMHHQNKMPVGPNAAGWEEPSPPSQRRSMPNFDDGTSLWGNPQQGSHWKDLPTGGGMGRGNNAAGPPGMAPSRGIKPDGGAVWGGQRNGWDELGGGPTGGSGNSAGVGWEESGPWPKQKMSGPLWEEVDWGHKQATRSQMTKEMVWNSKQFKMLVDMGYKKEEVENALRMREMNLEEALDLLSPLRRDGGWGNRHDDHYDHNQFPGQRFPSGPGGNSLSFQPNNPQNLLNSINNPGGSNSSLINNISPAVVQKMLTQGGGSQGFGGSMANRTMQPQSQPSTQQLKMLVQQIQMAVQSGYLNHQILNQPLAPQTLVLLNQLLQQIKTLQQLHNQHSLATQCINGKPNNQAVMQCTVLITKTRQQIANLQNQINAQQAIYVKQQQHQGNSAGGYDSFKTNPMHDSTINALQGNFADLTMTNKDPQVNHQQSRLNQWINKDKEEGGEFSRAPGPSSKPMATSPNIAPLGLTQPDGPWSTGRSGDTGWPDSGGGDSSNDVKDAQWSTTAQPSLTDLVPEFEPGKPWKGNQIKSIEDDPSITPGSVVRSPLSIATIKDTNELFNMNPNKSPPATDAMQPLSLSSSTWSFNPPSTSSAFTSSPQIKLPTSKGLGDLNPTTAVTSELWGAPKSRGPPPGLSAKGGNSLANGWTSNIGGSVPWGGGGGGQRSSGSWGGSSPWLLLKNLTAQIDGSTLRTLCMQHGPLLSFHLYLHQGFALAKYSSREEAVKAQNALNNCVLGNTTILTENPNDWDASALLQNVANQQSSSGGWRSSGKQQSVCGADTWSTGGWSANPAAAGSLWSSPLDSADAARATPSSLNSYLPNDLLGGESM